MCFSAEASFGLGGVLALTGGWCLRSAGRGNPAYLPLAMTPLLFGVQQMTEGLVWVGLGEQDPGLFRPAALAFLFFAIAFWPFWLPVCAARADSRPGARRLWAVIALLALGWLFFGYGPILVDPDRYLTVRVEHHSIVYDYSSSPMAALPQPVLRALYGLTGGLPLVACSEPRIRRFGLLLGLSAVLSQAVFSYAFASVWCFFAAALSGYLCLVLSEPTPRARTAF